MTVNAAEIVAGVLAGIGMSSAMVGAFYMPRAGRRDRALAVLVLGIVLGAAAFWWMPPDAFAATPNISGIDHEMGIAGYVFNPTTTAQTLTVPAGAYHANFTVWGGPVCVSTSSTLATTVNSDRWPEGLRVEKYNDRRMLLRMSFIKCSPGDTPSVQVYFYRALRTSDAYP